VFAAALAFATPRTLDPTTPAELTLWGLHGIAALDPSLDTDRVGGRLVLLEQSRMPPKILLTLPVPAPGDSRGWGDAAARLEAAAFEHSAVLQESGQQALIQSFFDEMFNHLDPYSRYVPPVPAEAERDRLSVDAGAGLGFVRRGHGLAVSDLVPGGPGEAAGLRVGDRILAVGGKRLRGDDPDDLRALLSGPEGTEIPLTVRGLDGRVRKIPVTLQAVPPETVFSSRDGKITIIRITAFTSNTAERLSQAIEAGLSSKPAPGADQGAGIIVDLRGNRGGLLRQAVTSVALFADHGVIASTEGRDPEATHDWRIEGGDLTHGLPVVLLVDGRTASAAEIMAAALADLGRGVVVGSATLGKGLVQTIARLPDGGEVFVTWSRVLAPLGWPLQSLGVFPQVCTSRGEAETTRELADLSDHHQDLAAPLAASRAARPPLPVAQAIEIRANGPAAEGRDTDMLAARFLIDHPDAYKAALIQSSVVSRQSSEPAAVSDDRRPATGDRR
jgi:carboxyl-terminal processing protease